MPRMFRYAMGMLGVLAALLPLAVGMSRPELHTASASLWIEGSRTAEANAIASDVNGKAWVELLRSYAVIEPALTQVGFEGEMKEAGAELSKNLTVRMDRGDNFLAVAYTDPDPERAVALLSAVVEHYGRVAGELKLTRLEHTVRVLEEQRLAIDETLTEAEADALRREVDQRLATARLAVMSFIPDVRLLDPPSLISRARPGLRLALGFLVLFGAFATIVGSATLLHRRKRTWAVGSRPDGVLTPNLMPALTVATFGVLGALTAGFLLFVM